MGNRRKKERVSDDDDADREFEDVIANSKMRWNFAQLKKSGVDWWTRVLLRFAPLRGVRRLSRKMGIDPDIADKANALFAGTERVDIVPSRTGTRGFQIILNRSTALYFYQDGDHFVYDGFESGEYDKGDVTLFDE